MRSALRTRGVADANIETPPRSACDLTNRGSVDAMLERSFGGRGPTLVLHAAGFVGGLGANRRAPARFFHDNLVMALNLVESCRARGLIGPGFKFVQVGTMCSYPASAPCPYREADLWSGLPDPEVASYGVAKLAILQMLEAYRLEHGLRWAYVIPTGFYGPGDNTNPANSHVAGALIRKYVDAAAAGEPSVTNWGTGSARRDLIYIDDAAEGVLRAAEVLDTPTPINLTSGREVAIGELAGLIAGLAGFRGETVWDASHGDGQARRSLDPTRARELLGWNAPTRLEDGLARSVAWYKAHGRASFGESH